MEIKIAEIERIVNGELHREYCVSSVVINDVLSKFHEVIMQWQGVHLDRIKKRPISRFRDYFVIGKNWWDLTKKKLLGNLFWLEIFRQIQRVRICFILHFWTICQHSQSVPKPLHNFVTPSNHNFVKSLVSHCHITTYHIAYYHSIHQQA